MRELCEREDIEPSHALFSRRELCAITGWSYSQVKRHLIRLQEFEYIMPRYGRMGSKLRYQLLVAPDPGAPDADRIGLFDVAKLAKSTTTTKTRTP